MNRIPAFKTPIATQLLRVVFGLYLIVAIIITATQMVFEYRYVGEQLDVRINGIKKSYGPSIANALWTYNETQIQSILKGINEISSVIGITIDDGNNTYNIGIVADRIKQHDIHETTKSTESLFSNLIKYEFPIIYDDGSRKHELGNGVIYSSTDIIFEQVKYGFILIIINSVIKTLVLWLIFIYFLRKIVSRPLTQLTSATNNINFENLDNTKIEIESQNNNELKVLENSFNIMIEKLAIAKNELDKTNASLENKVKQRTRSLQEEVATRKEAQHQAEAATNLKSRFLANMSHEIRTPMTCILGMAKILEHAEVNNEKKEKLNLIVRNGDRLLHIINNVLDYSKLEADAIKMDFLEYNIRESVARNIDLLDIQAKLKNITLDYFITDSVPKICRGDPYRLEQVIINILGNAIKFTDKGSVSVHVSLEAGTNKVLFSIKDSGIGIEAAKISSIFHEFVQADSSTNRQYGGTGLGLAISKRFVELMGGQLWVDSIQGEGSTFYFTINTFCTAENMSSNLAS